MGGETEWSVIYRAWVRPVTVQFLKNPDVLHWGFEASFLGEDQYGKWIAVPAGTKRWKGAQSFEPTRIDAVFCAPHEGWWHLHYNGWEARNYAIFIDINTPPRWSGDDRYEMIDLDLDVAMTREGEIVVEDEDEFEVHQVSYGYRQDMIDGALEATEWVKDALANRQEPFFEVAESWLRRLSSPA